MSGQLKNVPVEIEGIDRLNSEIDYLRAFRNSRTRLIETAASLCGSTADIMRGRCRTRDIALKRFRVYYMLHRMGFSYPDIGRMMRRHHTSALYGVSRVYAALHAAQAKVAA